MPHTLAKHYQIDMCSGAVLPKLLRFALPLTLSTMLQLMFNAADVVVVGRYAGDNSLAAVGSTSSLINLLTNLFVGLSVGANILAARYFGSRDHEGLRETVHTAVLLGAFCGAGLSVAGILGARAILVRMECPPEVLGLAAVYLRIYFAGMPASMLYNFGAALLRASGDTRRPLHILFAAGLVNVALNLVFVIRFQMDVAGVALATVISQCISAVLVLRCLMREEGPLHLDLRQLKIEPDRLRQIMRVGIPAGIQGTLFSFSNVTIQSAINSFQDTTLIAANSAAVSIENFLYANVNAFYQASTAFTSQNYGAGDYRRIRRILWVSLGAGAASTALLSGIVYLLGPRLLGIYSPNPAVIGAGMVRLRWVLAFYVLDSFMDVLVGSLRGMGYNVLPMVVTLFGACISRLVWVGTVFRVPRWHRIETVYVIYPISWCLTSLAHGVSVCAVYRRLVRRFRAHEAEVAAAQAAPPEGAEGRPCAEPAEGTAPEALPAAAAASPQADP